MVKFAFCFITTVLILPASGQVNLALHKNVDLFPVPDYYLTTDPLDNEQVTDGIALGSDWQVISTVGWPSLGLEHLPQIIIDLESTMVINEVRIYSIGGGVSDVEFPSILAVLVSDDGLNYGFAGAVDSEHLPKGILTPDGKIPHTFVINNLNVLGRYVKIILHPGISRFVFLDEIEIVGTTDTSGSDATPSINLEQITDNDELMAKIENQLLLRSELDSLVQMFEDNQSELDVTFYNNFLLDLQELSSYFPQPIVELLSEAQVIEIANAIDLLRSRLYQELYQKPYICVPANPMTILNETDMVLFDPNQSLQLSVELWKKEYESTAFNIINSSDELLSLNVSLSSLTGPGGIMINAQDTITIRRAIFVQAHVVGSIADAMVLQQSAPFQLPASTSTQIWLNVYNPDLLPGMYTCNINVEGYVNGQVTTTTLPLSINVREVSLPQSMAVNNCSWAYPLVSPVTVDHPEEVTQNLKDFYTNVYVVHDGFIPFPSQVSSAGEIIINGNYTLADDIINQNNFSKTFLFYFAFTSALKDEGIFGSWMSSSWTTAFTTWLQDWVAHLKSNGMGYDRFAMYPFDEQLGDRFYELAGLIKTIDPQIRIFANSFGDGPGDFSRFADRIDIWCLPINQTIWHLDWYETIKDFCKTMWTYGGVGPGKANQPYSYYRLMPWWAFKRGQTGVGFWKYVDRTVGPNWNDTGDPFGSYGVVYGSYNAPVDTQGEIIVPSRRWLAWREGIEDYQYLYELQRIIGLIEDINPQESSQAQEFLQNQIDIVLNAPDDHDTVYQVRNNLSLKLLALLEVYGDLIADRPQINVDEDQYVTQNTLLAFELFIIHDNPDGLYLTAENLPEGATFNSNIFSWLADEPGVYYVTFRISDGVLETTKTVTITVTSNNQAPVIQPIGTKQVQSLSTLSFPVIASDPDLQPVTLSAQNLPAGSSFVGQQFSWTPTSEQVGSHTVTFVASDGVLETTESVSINVILTNHPPVFVPIGTQSIQENSTLIFTVSATDENGDSLIYSAQNLPSGAVFADQVFSWTPNFNAAGEYSIIFVVSDSYKEATMTVSIIVDNVNQAPVFQPVNDIFIGDTEQILLTLIANDPDDDSLIYSVQGTLPGNSTLTANTFSWTLQYGDSGTYPITFVASDGDLQATASITITVRHSNQPPTINVLADQFINQYSDLTIPIIVTDSESDPVEVTVENLPSGASYANNSVTWTPGDGQDGVSEFTIQASDGQDLSNMTVTIYVMTDTLDSTPPFVSYTSPDDQAIQVPLNSLLVMEVADSGDGIDANSVIIQADGQDIYSGNVAEYSSVQGKTRRNGNQALYKYTFQPAQMYHNDQTVDITIHAQDLNGNAMNAHTFSFSTEMMTFGGVTSVHPPGDGLDQSHPVTTRDTQGNLWAAWQSGIVGSREIVVSRLLTGASAFENPVVVSAAGEPAHPAIAVDSNDTVYLCWQQLRDGFWNIYAANSSDGINWSAPLPVAQSDDHQTNPVMAADPLTAGRVYIVYQQVTTNIQDIHLASSSNGLSSINQIAVTSHSSQQINPDIAVADGVVYVVWTDLRYPTTSIYGASSANGWINTAIVNQPSNQSQPSLAAEDNGSALHLVWTDDQPGHQDIFYTALSDGFADTPLTGVTLIDDTTNRKQYNARVTATGSGGQARVFVGWQDERNSPTDSDIYFVDLSSSSQTNILVTTDTTLSSQTTPSLGINADNDPYLLWVDGRGPDNDIYYSGATNIAGEYLASAEVNQQVGGIVGTPFDNIDDVDDVSVQVPAAALWSDVTISITKVHNPIAAFDSPMILPAYEFSPGSDLEFSKPVTITIPFETTENIIAADIALYNPQTGRYSQSGLSNIEVLKISPTLSALRFDTTHFFLVQTHLQIGNAMAW